MHRTVWLTVIGFVLVTIVYLSIFSFISIAAKTPPNGQVSDSFSIIQITDTQFLSEYYPQLYNNLTSWIVASRSAENTLMVVHTGDIVNVANSTREWINANYAMMLLYNNSVPYCWDAGNHDLIKDGADQAPNAFRYIGKNYPAFNTATMSGKPYWVSSIYDGTSTAVKFSFKNYKFMVINVQYDGNMSVLAWMEKLIEDNPKVNIVVATHNFLNGNGGYGYSSNTRDLIWAREFESILDKHPNVFMTLSGHDVGEGSSAQKNVAIGKSGFSREEVFFNMQNQFDRQGAAVARIYTFNVTYASKPAATAYDYATAVFPAHAHGLTKMFHLYEDQDFYEVSPQNLSKRFSFYPHLISS